MRLRFWLCVLALSESPSLPLYVSVAWVLMLGSATGLVVVCFGG